MQLMDNSEPQTAPMTQAQMDILLKALNDKTKGACHRCGTMQFSLQPGFGQVFLQPHTKNVHLGGGPMMPVVYVVCANCGLVNTHALGPLGVMEKPEFDLG